jgi:hypothetical protein
MENSATKTAGKRKQRIVKSVSSGMMVTEDDIRRRAFEIYLENGVNSNDFDNWLKAERELRNSMRAL